MSRTAREFESLRSAKERAKGRLITLVDFEGDPHIAARRADTIRQLPGIGTSIVGHILGRAMNVSVSSVLFGEHDPVADREAIDELDASRQAMVDALRPYAETLGSLGAVNEGRTVIDISAAETNGHLLDNELVTRAGCGPRSTVVGIIPRSMAGQLWIPGGENAIAGDSFIYRGGSFAPSSSGPVWERIIPR